MSIDHNNIYKLAEGRIKLSIKRIRHSDKADPFSNLFKAKEKRHYNDTNYETYDYNYHGPQASGK